MQKILESLKAIASLVGAIAASLVAVIGDGQAAHIVAIVIAVCTGIVTWVVPNAGTSNDSNAVG